MGHENGLPIRAALAVIGSFGSNQSSSVKAGQSSTLVGTREFDSWIA